MDNSDAWQQMTVAYFYRCSAETKRETLKAIWPFLHFRVKPGRRCVLSNDMSFLIGDVDEFIKSIRSGEAIVEGGQEPYASDYYGTDIEDLEDLPGLSGPEREYLRLLAGIHLGIHPEYDRSGLPEEYGVTCALSFEQLKPIWESIKRVDLDDLCTRYGNDFPKSLADYGVFAYLSSYMQLVQQAIDKQAGILAMVWV